MGYTLPQLEDALVKLHGSGRMDEARKIAVLVKQERERQSTDEGAKWELEQGQQPIAPGTIIDQESDPTLGQKAVGTLETGAALVGGGVLGSAGYIAGTAKGLGQTMIDGSYGTREGAEAAEAEALKMSQAGANLLAPRTETGKEMLGDVAKTLEPLASLPPVIPGATVISNAARKATGLAPAVAGKVAAKAQEAGQAAGQAAKGVAEKIPGLNQAFAPKPEPQGKSIGAAEADAAELRIKEAEALRVPIKLSKGDAERDNLEQQKFEENIKKLPEGERLRKLEQENNLKLLQNIDEEIDDIGAFYSENKGAGGKTIIDGLQKEKDFLKNNTKYHYKRAQADGALKEQVDMAPLAEFLNKERGNRLAASSMNSVAEQLKVLELGSGDFTDGSLTLGKMTLEQAESLIKHINATTDFTDGRDARMAGMLKKTIDAQTEKVGNKLYKKARSARVKQAEYFDNVGIIKDLLRTKKGTTDRVVPLEKVIEKIATSSSADNASLKTMRKVLLGAGEEGQQAWKEVQGGVLAYIRDNATTTATDGMGTKILSAAKLSNTLDPLIKSGKLETIFTTRQRRQLELLNSVAGYVKTTAPGVANPSGTATALTFLADILTSGFSGIPMPIATASKMLAEKVKDKKLQARIDEALRTNAQE